MLTHPDAIQRIRRPKNKDMRDSDIAAELPVRQVAECLGAIPGTVYYWLAPARSPTRGRLPAQSAFPSPPTSGRRFAPSPLSPASPPELKTLLREVQFDDTMALPAFEWVNCPN